MVDTVVFVLAALVILIGALGVILARNPVHSALMLVMTLFGVAVVFVAQDAHFLAAVQVIVYAGAIVVLFLFVIMLLGVDQADRIETEPIGGQRPAAGVVALASVGLLVLLAVRGVQVSTGARSTSGALDGEGTNLVKLARVLFTDYLFAFEATSALLVIAVVGAVVLARKPAPEDVQDRKGEAVGGRTRSAS
ncbi:MAG: NADH-quinone oxidoreductase subunit J [Actinomycetota bacterium]|nr:NADH-quinone oxidoreductase subunit J [Actinomycetota bacterium]